MNSSPDNNHDGTANQGFYEIDRIASTNTHYPIDADSSRRTEYRMLPGNEKAANSLHETAASSYMHSNLDDNECGCVT
jgi:hypothetical protein